MGHCGTRASRRRHQCQAIHHLRLPHALPAVVAHALRCEQEWLDGMVSELAECRSILVEGLKQLGFHVHDTGGTYYVVADLSPTGMNGIDFCMQLPETKGVAAIPLAAFTDNPEPWQYKVRFAFCKRPEVIREAVRRLTAES
nr:aminotransferase class I/II-fold pyridoxal phosphate-dependent enzyme [Corynebacterium accolens]